ncbi:S-layer homology domain-containing protein [Paenibacillus tianjinensis]|uniref:S-layer homology domain-containing protein n=1 Tax=Paenibacillus tianjinensis TaxID=2810347 RepID=A0ABX7L967_9BACL|nr:S-layer homology domain-containing protein [Paenibacillus tianjinensis]QSF44730.1 S-layer homology domain-containing protein [Paenibacillus tianjinensis]
MKMKKALRGLMTGLLGVTMLFGALGSVSAAPAAKDIQGHWAQNQLQDWLNKGYLQGYADGTVKPNKPITRGEYVALVNRLFGFTETASIAFKDLKSSNWAYSEVAKAVKAGYIGGYENNTFRSASPLTRQEAAVITAKLLSLDTSNTSLTFKDSAQIASWAKGAVAAAAAKNIINGYPDGTFGPKRPLTRAEAVGIIGNSAANKPSGSGNPVTPTPTPSATATPTPTPTPTSTTGGGSGGGGGGGGTTAPTVSNITYGHVGSVTADVYLTPSVTGAVYYVVAPYSSTAAVPSTLQIQNGLTSTGTAGVNYGKVAATGNTTVAFSVYGLQANTEYAAYIALSDSVGSWSAVSTLRLTTAPGGATAITELSPGSMGTVTADVYVTYGQAGGASAPVRYVVLPANAADPSAAQVAAGQNSSGVQLSAPWTGTISPAPAPGVRQTLTLSGLSAHTDYKVYVITGSGSSWSPVEILRIHTK